MLNRLRLWIRSNVLRRRLEREMRQEMADHLDRSTARLMARGLSEDAARREAVREFGNVAYLQTEARHARGTIWLDALAADCRFALRHFSRRPAATLVMFVVLAVGMSISTMLFSYVHSYAVQPPPCVPRDPDLVRIRGSLGAGVDGRGSRSLTEEELREYRQLSDQFASVAGWTFGAVVLDAGDGPDRRGVEARATFVTENYFEVLGVRPLLGPGLPASSGDVLLDDVVVLGHTAWEQLFDRDPGVIGARLLANGVPLTVVGVAPERFIGVAGYERIQLWMPLAARRLVADGPVGGYRAAARLRPGVSPQAATAAVEAVVARAAAADPGLRALEPSADVVRLLSANGDPMFDRDVRLMSVTVGLLGLIVLLVTCTNVSALLTGLASARRQEIAIRLSLGAPRSRIIRQLLTESALLASLAAAAALGIVWFVLRAADAALPFIPLELGVTWRATTFTFGIALAVGVAFGLSPALHATRLAIATAMRDSTGAIAATRARLQRGLVVAQIALTQPLIVLLAAVLLFVLANYTPQGRTAEADRLVTITLRPPPSMAGGTGEAREQLDRAIARLLDNLRATPGIEAVALDGRQRDALGTYRIAPEDRLPGTVEAFVALAGERTAAGYLGVRGIRIVRGRDLTDAAAAAPVGGDVPAVISAHLAQRLWPNADPLGRRLQPASDTAVATPRLVVVGVAADPLAGSHRPGDEYRVWIGGGAAGTPRSMLIRTAGPAGPLLPTIRHVLREQAPTVETTLRTVADVESENSRRFRIVSGGLIGAGVVALLLSALGLYAVVAFSVGERTREIAVRIAVGAGRGQIARKFLSDGLRLSMVGLAIGLPVSLLALHAAMTLLADDIPTVSILSVTLLAALGVVSVATAAAWIPARRAAAVDPAVTLRRE
jgi:predicted permease